MKLKILASAFVLSTAWALPAAAGTSLELLQGWNYNEDYNGDKERTTLTIKTFQPWEYGSLFAYYDITGPFGAPDLDVAPNEKGGMFGSITLAFSIKRMGEKIAGSQWDWGALGDLSLRYELETASKFGTVNYYGLLYDLNIPHFDFVSLNTVIRDDWSLSGADLQLGGAWQITFPLGEVTDIVFDGFFSWGVFGEGKGEFTVGPDSDGKYASLPQEGRSFFLTQPQLLFDVLKLARVAPGKVYAGIEYQFAWNRYLLPNVHEHVPQIMLKWNI